MISSCDIPKNGIDSVLVRFFITVTKRTIRGGKVYFDSQFQSSRSMEGWLHSSEPKVKSDIMVEGYGKERSSEYDN